MNGTPEGLEGALGELFKMGREIEDLAVTSVQVVEALENKEHGLHWSDEDAAESVWKRLDDMAERHKAAVQAVEEHKRILSGEAMSKTFTCPNCGATGELGGEVLVPVWGVTDPNLADEKEPDHIGCTECNTMEDYEEYQ